MSKEKKDRAIGLVISERFYDKVKKRADSQKRTLSQIARLLMEKAIEAEDDLQKRIYGKDSLKPEDLKEIKSTMLDFNEFMDDWMEGIDKRKDEPDLSNNSDFYNYMNEKINQGDI